MNIGEDEVLPIITPYGYIGNKKHMKEVLICKLSLADKLKNWEQLFYNNDFNSNFTKESAGDLEFPLEMVRLSSSVLNK